MTPGTCSRGECPVSDELATVRAVRLFEADTTACGREHQFKAVVSRRSNGFRRFEHSQLPRVARSPDPPSGPRPRPPRILPQRRNVSRETMRDKGLGVADDPKRSRNGRAPRRNGPPASPPGHSSLSPSPPESPRPRHDPSCTRVAGDIARRRSRQTGPSRTTGCCRRTGRR